MLAPIFDSLRRYRKFQGHILLSFIHNFISDGRMIRIGGVGNEQFLPLTKRPDAPEYDIIVDQAPNSPDVKEQTWETLQNLVPGLLNVIPTDPFDGRPLRYKKLAKGYVVYSIGPDGEDNAGAEKKTLSNAQRIAGNKEPPYDITFTVER